MPKAIVTADSYPFYQVPTGYVVDMDDNGDVVFKNPRGAPHKPDPEIRSIIQHPYPFHPTLARARRAPPLSAAPAPLGRMECYAQLPSGATNFTAHAGAMIPPSNPANSTTAIHYIWCGLSKLDSAGDYQVIIHPVMRCVYPGTQDVGWKAWPSFFHYVYGVFGTSIAAMTYNTTWSCQSWRDASGSPWYCQWIAPSGQTSPDTLSIADSYWTTGRPDLATLGGWEPFNIGSDCYDVDWFYWGTGSFSTDQGGIPNNSFVGWVDGTCSNSIVITSNTQPGQAATFKTYKWPP